MSEYYLIKSAYVYFQENKDLNECQQFIEAVEVDRQVMVCSQMYFYAMQGFKLTTNI